MAKDGDRKPSRRVRTRVETTIDDERGVFMISVAAELAEMHPQTLRMYEARGLIEPKRSPKGTRLYSHSDVERLRRIQELTSDAGMNLAGVEKVFELEHALYAGQVEPELGRHRLDAAQTLDVGLRVQPRALGRALGLDQAAGLVHAQGLGVHLGQLGGDGDHEHAAVVVDHRADALHRTPSVEAAAWRSTDSRGLPLSTRARSSTASRCSAFSDSGTSMTKR